MTVTGRIDAADASPPDPDRAATSLGPGRGRSTFLSLLSIGPDPAPASRAYVRMNARKEAR
jgi:hypothetical protein